MLSAQVTLPVHDTKLRHLIAHPASKFILQKMQPTTKDSTCDPMGIKVSLNSHYAIKYPTFYICNSRIEVILIYLFVLIVNYVISMNNCVFGGFKGTLVIIRFIKLIVSFS
jgi:hypothetical protein